MSAELTTEPEPEEPISTKTRVILNAIERLELKLGDLQDVTEAVREIRQSMGINKNWQSSIVRALKHFVSLIDPPANGRRNGQ